MSCEKYTSEEKLELLKKWAEKVGGTEIPISEICLELGVWAGTIDIWAKNDPELGKIYNSAAKQRAWAYADKAHKIIAEAQAFYDYEMLTRDGARYTVVRECNSIINKARFHVDTLFKLASVLAPDTFGDLRYEIKQIHKEINDLKKTMEIKK